MKAYIIEKYGTEEMLKIAQLAMPSPASRQVLVEIHASSVNPIDWKIRKGELKLISGFRFPRFLGADLSGRVIKVGDQVKRFKEGDEVYGLISALKGGAYATHLVLDESALALKPVNLNFQQAAAIPLAGQTALQGLRDRGEIQLGQQVLINGCTGGVGTFAVQIAKKFGAIVTGVCSTANQAFAHELGCDYVHDYTKEDLSLTERNYDLIFDAVGKMELSVARKLLTAQGNYVSTLPSGTLYFREFLSRLTGERKFCSILLGSNAKDLTFLKDLSESGHLKVVIDKVYDFKELPQAHHYSQQGHAKGKIVIAIVT